MLDTYHASFKSSISEEFFFSCSSVFLIDLSGINLDLLLVLKQIKLLSISSLFYLRIK